MSKKKKKDKDKSDKKSKKLEPRKVAAVKSLKSAAPSERVKAKSKSSDKRNSPLKTKDQKPKDLKLKVKEKNRIKDKGRDKDRPVVRILERKSVPEPVRAAPVKLTKEQLEIRARLQTMLSEMRRDIDHEVRGASERDLNHLNDTSDMATDAAEGDLALRIAESETVEAEEIERAIDKIDNGTYGVCEMCTKPIGSDRIKFLPYVTLCIKCQELSEIRRRESGEELDDLAEGAETDNDA